MNNLHYLIRFKNCQYAQHLIFYYLDNLYYLDNNNTRLKVQTKKQ